MGELHELRELADRADRADRLVRVVGALALSFALCCQRQHCVQALVHQRGLPAQPCVPAFGGALGQPGQQPLGGLRQAAKRACRPQPGQPDAPQRAWT